MRVLYSLLLTLMLPVILARLLWRSLRQPGYRDNIAERFGSYSQPALRGCIWIHAVSVGETRATEPLIRKLKALYPSRPILLTSMTPTGRAAAIEMFGDSLTSAYLPYDLGYWHRGLFERFEPVALLVMETEIWPNLLHACKSRSVPALIVNARLSERSARGYRRFAPVRTLVQHALENLSVVAAQSVADADRFRTLGATRVCVTGNVKFDLTLNADLVNMGCGWRAGLGNRQVLLCASTREGEEALLLAAYLEVFKISERSEVLLAIVPRHPQRFDEVARLVADAGLTPLRRSEAIFDAAVITADVLLGDSMGEMAAYLALADIVIVGGSFLPLGGQNLIEACAAGKPVIMGPSTFNFSEAARLADDQGAMVKVNDAVEALRAAKRLLQDVAASKAMSEAGLKLVAANRGATDRTVDLVRVALAGK